MKIETGASATTSNIQSASRSFSIQASGKAFKVLSSSLYNFKILAVVREISCNARDAHAMGGKLEQPFLVKLPSMEDLHFTVRDYGPGLSPEDVMGIYTTYFGSTKTGDNDQIGGFGLGSKSPLSYATSFQVCTYWHGVKTTFLAFQNDNGEPDIYQLTQQDTSEPNGLEVIVPVNENDVRKFRNSAEHVYRHFQVPPTVQIGRQVVTTGFDSTALDATIQREVVYEDGRCGRFYAFSGALSEITNGAVWAQMGDVIYPVTVNAVFDNQKPDELKIQRFFESGRFGKLIIECKIGELDLNAGREGLSYDRATIGRLKTILSMLHGKLINEANAEIAKASHYDVALRDSFKFQQFFGRDAVYGMFTWRGMKVDISNTSTFPNMSKTIPEWKTLIDHLVKEGKGDGMRYSVLSNVRGELVVRQLTGANIERVGLNFEREVEVIVVDEPLTGARGSLKDRLINKFGNSAYDKKSIVILKVSLISTSTNLNRTNESATCVYKDVAKNRDALKKVCSENTIVKNIQFLSDLPVAAVKPKTPGLSTANGIRRVAEEVYCQTVQVKGHNHLYKAVNFGTDDFDPEAKSKRIYIEGNKSKVVFRSGGYSTSRTANNSYWDNTNTEDMSLLHAWAEHHAEKQKSKNFKLYYLNEKQIEEVKDNKNWVTAESQMFDDFAEMIKSAGKYGALKLEHPSLADQEVLSALKAGSADFRERIKVWNELSGQRDANTFSHYGFGALMLKIMVKDIEARWKEFTTKAAVDMTLYPTYDAWVKVFRSGRSISFGGYIDKMSAVVALSQFGRWQDSSRWKPEICSIWDQTPNKIAVTDYLDQFFTGK